MTAEKPHGDHQVDKNKTWQEWLERINLPIQTAAGAVVILGFLVGALHLLHLPALTGWILLGAGLIAFASGLLLPRRWRMPTYSVIAAGVLIALLAVLFWPRPPCSRALVCSARVCYDFAAGTTQGWGIRTENGVRLGTEIFATDSPHVEPPVACLWPGESIELTFRLGAPPTDKAQIQIGNVSLTKQLSTWVYVPSNTPQTLELFAFVLEHNTGAEPGKPEWPFYKTQIVTLHIGGWTEATFPVSDFVGVNTNQPWSNPPLLIGFEIHAAEPGEFDGVAYFAHISVT